MNCHELGLNMIVSIIIGLPIMLICNHICSTPNPIRIYIWIQKRYDYYDKLFGASYGDKYTDRVFSDASWYLGKTKEELDKLYWQGVLVFTARQQKKYDKREKKRLTEINKINKRNKRNKSKQL